MFKFITILLLEMLCGAELDIFVPSLPDIQQQFNLSPFMVQFTISANLIAFCICGLIAGALGDRYNRRYVILISLLIFILGSLLCIFAQHYHALILGRILQGIGIAGPATLAYVIIADENPIAKQIELMGVLNGIITLSMALAPIIGSFIAYYFSWRGNFVFLGCFGIVCFLASFLTIPSRNPDLSISLSLKAYKPFLFSKKFMLYLFSISLFVVPYWLFISLAPILYIKSIGVPLKFFGFYQGSLIFFFALVSLMSPLFLKKFSAKKCFYFGVFLCFISIILILIISILNVMDPMIITFAMVLYSIGAVFPVNILYPLSLDILENTKGRAAAILQAMRLLLTAITLQLVSYLYTGVFAPIGLAIFITAISSMALIYFITQRNWLEFNKI